MKQNLSRVLATMALLALVIVSPTIAQTQSVVGPAACEGTACDRGNVAVSFEGGGDWTVSTQAFGLVFNPVTGFHEGTGSIEVRDRVSGARIVYDPAAAFKVSLVPGGISEMHAIAAAEKGGQAFTLDASRVEIGFGIAELRGEVSLSQGLGKARKSFGAMKAELR